MRLRFFKFMSFILCVLLLTQCNKAIEPPVPVVRAEISKPLVSPYSKPATAYLALAKNQTALEQQASYLKAAGRLAQDGRWRDGFTILAKTRELSPELAREKQLLLAKIDLIRGQPRAAINKLSAIQDIEYLPAYENVQFHEILAESYASIGNGTASIMERIKLEKLLPDEASKAKNRQALWLMLTKLPAAELHTLAVEAKDGTALGGWLNLAVISRKQYAHSQKLLGEVEQWQAKYPEHPGNRLLPSPLTTASNHLFTQPKQIALLLPLTGPLAGPGAAIKDGFMTAFHAHNKDKNVKVDFYNTDLTENIAALYEQAIADGANYIIGPLSKSDVAKVAAMEHPVPTLLLNDIATHPGEHAYQFGLSPSNEARQIAIKARKSGYIHALVIVPAGSWGDEVAQTFAKQWSSESGRVVDTWHYQANEDMSMGMRHFLQVTDSEARGKQLKQLLGYNMEFNPSRRQDFDMIFLLAYPSKARQIMPMLKYYYAGDVPVYATSTVYAGGANPMKDRDLNGLIFCDLPWVLEHQMASRNWPEQFNSYSRLYALGRDSYTLATKLNQLSLFPALSASDNGGAFYLTSSQQIERVLAWGQFKQGVAQKIESVA